MLSAKKWNCLFISLFPENTHRAALISFLRDRKFEFLLKKPPKLFLYSRFTHPFEHVAEGDNSHALTQSFCWMTKVVCNALLTGFSLVWIPLEILPTTMFQLPKHHLDSECCHQLWSSCGGYEICKFYVSRVTSYLMAPSDCKPFLPFPSGRWLSCLLGCISKATLSSSRSSINGTRTAVGWNRTGLNKDSCLL